MNTKINKIFSSKRFRNGSYTWLVTVILIAIVIVVNLIYRQLPSSMRNVDISSTNIYNISDVTKEILAALDKDVELVVVAESGSVDTRIERFLELYAEQSDRISVRYEDPVASPSVLKKYGTTADTIVVSCEETGRTDIIYFEDMIVYDLYSYYYYGTYNETEFDAEGQLTGAINLVTNEASRKIYMLQGHQESSFGETITDMLAKSNLTAETVNIFKEGSIPSDCEMLVSYAPLTDFSEEEIELIRDYMDQGGNFILIMTLEGETPNLDAFMEEYGLSKAAGSIADTRQAYMGNPYYLLPTINSSNISASLPNDSAVLVFNACGVTEAEEIPENVVVTPVLSTSSQGFAVTETEQVQGTYLLAAYATKTVSEDISSTFTVFTTDTIINENLLTAYSNISNAQIFLNALTVDFDDIISISIEPVSLEVTYNTVTNQSFWGLWLIFIIPIGVLIFGFVKWLIRRRK